MIILQGCQSTPPQATVSVDQPSPHNQTALTHKINPLIETTPIQFRLAKGSLKENLSRLLDGSSDYQVLWEVSEHHRVASDMPLTAPDIYSLVNDIISPYRQPAQIKASFYGNRIVRFYYDGHENQ